ncbi:hypothetical protein L1987_56507 [Smallanthus sonchifolius]|uniref:Uncharacterized protein n=1 Tax=Smallanthus sonchifolius TaxID=185202 RepID=A0ACB9EDC9_9ASTR|nr:hypothetical protein L1987_56507 [Smallanthus sonchifolius]
MTAKEKIDAAAAESLDPYVRKIRDEKYGWKYGLEVTSKVREDLYFQNYTNDDDAPGGTPVMQPSLPKDRPQRHRPGIANRLKDTRREHDGRNNSGERFDRGENPENDGGGGHPDDQIPLGPFVPAPPEVAMRMLRDQGVPSLFEGGGRNGWSGPQISGPAPIIALPPSFRLPRRIRSYLDRDAPEDEVTVIDYRSL